MEDLMNDAQVFSLSDWEICQALRQLIDQWEQQLNIKMFLEWETFSTLTESEEYHE